jgi:hypothetical protein
VKKIFLVAGAVFLLALLIGVWFFLGNLGALTQLLGKTSTGLVEESTFFGTWESEDAEVFVFSSDGSYQNGFIQGI